MYLLYICNWIYMNKLKNSMLLTVPQSQGSPWTRDQFFS